MKKALLIGFLVIILLYAFRQLVYDPYKWKKAISTPEHKLQLGSFIFSKQRSSNGSQSMQNYYFIFKVIEIKDDYVRLSVIRQLSEKGKLKSSDFSTSKETYKTLKNSISKIIITPIIFEDLYKGENPNSVNDYLLEKYPSLKRSRYYYEVVEYSTDSRQYFSLVYSKDKIISKGKLVPWILNNSEKPELAERLSQNIDLILN